MRNRWVGDDDRGRGVWVGAVVCEKGEELLYGQHGGDEAGVDRVNDVGWWEQRERPFGVA